MIKSNDIFYIFSPFSEQSYFIAAILKKYYPSAVLYGVLIPEEKSFFIKVPKNLRSILKIKDLSVLDEGGCIIPTGAISTKYCLEKKNIFLGEIIHKSVNLRVFNKPWLLNEAMSCGVLIPETWDSIESIAKFPVFYKQKYETGGGIRGVAYKNEKIPNVDQDSLIFQEFIISKGTYGVSFLAHEGRMICQNTHFERESIPEDGGSAIIIESFEDERLLINTKKLLSHLNYSGWGVVEFKYCEKRKNYVLMEINAKFWASCEFAFVNEPIFLKKLFDIDSNETAVDSILFVDRAAKRGFIFFIKSIIGYRGKVRFCIYPNWFFRVVNSFAPKFLTKYLKLFINRFFN